MAATERVSMVPTMSREIQTVNFEMDSFLPGLRVMARTTSSSLSDYPEWNVEDLSNRKKNLIVTDGACS